MRVCLLRVLACIARLTSQPNATPPKHEEPNPSKLSRAHNRTSTFVTWSRRHTVNQLSIQIAEQLRVSVCVCVCVCVLTSQWKPINHDAALHGQLHCLLEQYQYNVWRFNKPVSAVTGSRLNSTVAYYRSGSRQIPDSSLRINTVAQFERIQNISRWPYSDRMHMVHQALTPCHSGEGIRRNIDRQWVTLSFAKLSFKLSFKLKLRGQIKN